MDLEHLRYFQAVAECQHITHAAEQLHISQPSLSKAISNVEDFAGAALFRREKNKIYLNECGKTFTAGLTEFFAIMDSARDSIRNAISLETGIVRIATSIGSGALNDYLIDLHGRHPGILISQNKSQEQNMVQELVLERADLAVSSHPLSQYSSQIISKLLLTEELLLLVPEDHPFSEKTSVTMQELAHEQVIFNSSGMDLQERIIEAYRTTGCFLNIALESSSPDLIGSIMEQEKRMSLIPVSANHRMEHRHTNHPKLGHKAIHIEGAHFYRQIFLNCLEGAQISEASRLIIRELPTYFKKEYSAS